MLPKKTGWRVRYHPGLISAFPISYWLPATVQRRTSRPSFIVTRCGRIESGWGFVSSASAVMYEKGPVRVVEMFGHWCVRNTSGVVAQCLLPGLENGKEVAAANARRIAATWNACEEAGLSTAALEAGVVRELVEAADRYLRAMTRDTDDDPNCWAEEEFAEAWLRE